MKKQIGVWLCIFCLSFGLGSLWGAQKSFRNTRLYKIFKEIATQEKINIVINFPNARVNQFTLKNYQNRKKQSDYWLKNLTKLGQQQGFKVKKISKFYLILTPKDAFRFDDRKIKLVNTGVFTKNRLQKLWEMVDIPGISSTLDPFCGQIITSGLRPSVKRFNNVLKTIKQKDSNIKLDFEVQYPGEDLPLASISFTVKSGSKFWLNSMSPDRNKKLACLFNGKAEESAKRFVTLTGKINLRNKFGTVDVDLDYIGKKLSGKWAQKEFRVREGKAFFRWRAQIEEKLGAWKFIPSRSTFPPKGLEQLFTQPYFDWERTYPGESREVDYENTSYRIILKQLCRRLWKKLHYDTPAEIDISCFCHGDMVTDNNLIFVLSLLTNHQVEFSKEDIRIGTRKYFLERNGGKLVFLPKLAFPTGTIYNFFLKLAREHDLLGDVKLDEESGKVVITGDEVFFNLALQILNNWKFYSQYSKTGFELHFGFVTDSKQAGLRYGEKVSHEAGNKIRNLSLEYRPISFNEAGIEEIGTSVAVKGPNIRLVLDYTFLIPHPDSPYIFKFGGGLGGNILLTDLIPVH